MKKKQLCAVKEDTGERPNLDIVTKEELSEEVILKLRKDGSKELSTEEYGVSVARGA